MANPERGSRSGAIRDYLKSNPKAGPKEIVAALGAQGISVTKGLVSNIKYGAKPNRGRGPRKARMAPAVTAAPARRGSGSEAIRVYLRQHPQAGPREVQASLAKDGITVSLGLISFVKYHKPKRRSKAPSLRVAARRTPGRGRGRPSANGLTIEQLLEAKRLVDSVGDINRVRQALDALERLR